MDKTKKKFDKKAFKTVVTNMLDGFDKEHLESPMFKHLIKKSEWLDTPSHTQTMIVHPFRRTLELAISMSQNQSDEVTRLWLDYDFLENNVSELCSQLYGHGCCVDRGSFIVNSYIQFKVDGVIPKLDWTKEYTFHYPNTGDMKQWFAFVAGVYRLKYGINKEYLFALKTLMSLKEVKK